MSISRRTIAGLLALVCITAFLCACSDKRKEYRLDGHTMGTNYSVLFVLEPNVSLDEVSSAITRELKAVNDSMSVFNPQSEISRFNAMSAAETQSDPFAASAAFYAVMEQAQTLHILTGGAWDCTVMPLVDLWGFGPKGTREQPPDATEIATLLTEVGFSKIALGPERRLLKQAEVSVDLASIAKGYGVDRVVQALNDLGLKSFLVEIGGEIYAKGVKLNGQKWRVGINLPDTNALVTEVYAVTELNDLALATSGNYRNYFETDGEIYTHILDPRTGYPVKSEIASISVIAPTCAKADGLATAMTVLGVEQSLALAEADPEVEVFIITRGGNGAFVNHMSKGMPRFLADYDDK